MKSIELSKYTYLISPKSKFIIPVASSPNHLTINYPTPSNPHQMPNSPLHYQQTTQPISAVPISNPNHPAPLPRKPSNPPLAMYLKCQIYDLTMVCSAHDMLDHLQDVSMFTLHGGGILDVQLSIPRECRRTFWGSVFDYITHDGTAISTA